jgi:hypothetical protein
MPLPFPYLVLHFLFVRTQKESFPFIFNPIYNIAHPRPSYFLSFQFLFSSPLFYLFSFFFHLSYFFLLDPAPPHLKNKDPAHPRSSPPRSVPPPSFPNPISVPGHRRRRPVPPSPAAGAVPPLLVAPFIPLTRPPPHLSERR